MRGAPGRTLEVREIQQVELTIDTRRSDRHVVLACLGSQSTRAIAGTILVGTFCFPSAIVQIPNDTADDRQQRAAEKGRLAPQSDAAADLRRPGISAPFQQQIEHE
jgi:hypothetical protein